MKARQATKYISRLIALFFFFSVLSSARADESEFSKQIAKTKFHRHDGKRYRKAKLEKTPKYFFLYHSASWCGPCKATAPQLVEKYRSEIASNPEITFIQISRDDREGDASKWAKEAGLPWLTVLPINVGRSKLMEYRTADATPFYTLLDTEGKALATGLEEVFSKLAELSKSGSE